MGDGHAKPEGSHPGDVADLVEQLSQDDPYAGVVSGVDPGQVRRVVVATAPLQLGEVGGIARPEVVERAEQVGLEGVPEPQLGCGTPIEEVPDVEAVAALRGGSQAQQLARLEVREQALVRRCLGVVELVDHHHVVLLEPVHAGA